MNEGLIPRRYAKALYKYAQEKGCAKEVYADTQVLEKAFASHPSLSKSWVRMLTRASFDSST